MNLKSKSLWAVAALLLSPLTLSHPQQATAAPGDPELGYYISKPFVQNSYLASEPGYYLETFDNSTLNELPANSSIFNWSTEVSGSFRAGVRSAASYGGAITTSSAQVVDPTNAFSATGGSRFVTNGSDNLTISFSENLQYLGFWWSAGNSINRVTFFDGTTELLTIDSGTLAGTGNPLGLSPTGAGGTFGSTGALSIGGVDYKRHYYWSNPKGYTTTSPTSQGPDSPDEPFAYIHFVAQNGMTFNRVTFSGGGFEFDNLVASTYSPTVDSNELYFVGTVTQTGFQSPTVTFDANFGSPAATASQTAASATSLSANTFVRPGFEFAGWNTEPDGTGTSYADLATYSFAQSDILYAQWTALPSMAEVEIPAAAYSGPVINCPSQPQASQSRVKLSGSKMDQVNAVAIGGQSLPIIAQTADSIDFTLPALTNGKYSLVFETDGGRLIAQDCLTVGVAAQVVIDSANPSVIRKSFVASNRLTAFTGDRSPLSARHKSQLRNWLKSFDGITQVNCVGSTSGRPSLRTDLSLALRRAELTCSYLKTLLPNAAFTTGAVTGKGIGSYFRATQVSIVGETR